MRGSLHDSVEFEPLCYKRTDQGEEHYIFRFPNNRGLSILPSRCPTGLTLHGLWEARLLGFYGPDPTDRILEHAPSLGMLPASCLNELLVEVRNMHPRLIDVVIYENEEDN